MLIKYTYEEPDNKEEWVYNSVEEFLATSHGRYYRDMFAEGRLEHLWKIVMDVDYPARITVEVLS